MQTLKKYLPYLLVLGAGTSWGFMGLFSKNIIAAGYSSMTAVFIRNVGAFLTFTVIFALFDRSVFKIEWKHLPIFMFTGFVSVFLFGMCYFTGVKYHSMAVASVLLYTSPAFIILLSRIVNKTPITKKKVFCLLLCMLGCCCISGIFSGDFSTTPLGFLLGLGSGLTYASYSIVSPMGLKHYRPLTVIYYTFLFAALGTLSVMDTQELYGVITTPSVLCNGIAFFLVATVIPYFLYTTGLNLLGDAGKAGILACSEPVMAAVAGALFLHEPITLTVALGIACVLAAVVVTSKE